MKDFTKSCVAVLETIPIVQPQADNARADFLTHLGFGTD
jgi:hypothetical protein